MGIAGVIPIVAATAGVCVALLAWAANRRVALPELRTLSILTATAAAYATCDYFMQGGHSDRAVVVATHVGIAVLAAHTLGWISLMSEERLTARPRLHQALRNVSLGIAGASLIPGLFFDGRVTRVTIQSLGVEYATASPTTVGVLVLAYYAVVAIVPIVYYGVRFKRDPAARPYAIAIASLFVAAVNDSATGSELIASPYLASLGLLPLIVVAGLVVVRRYNDSTAHLAELSANLDRLVMERTAELMDAQTALMNAERLAALGQVAAGVAHEINHPSAVVVANVAYLRDNFVDHAMLPEDTGECLNDSLDAMARIRRIVEQLLDTARAAKGKRATLSPVDLEEVAASIVTAMNTAEGHELRIDLTPPLHCFADRAPLEQVLVNLVRNGIQAAQEVGRAPDVSLSARRVGDRCLVHVKDNGGGLTPDAQRHLFEPFFTTKRERQGTGLGLSVSLGLVRSLGGELRVEQTGPAGTTMVVDLAWTPSPVETPDARSRAIPAQRANRPTLLLIDDEPQYREAMVRLLAGRFDVRVAQDLATGMHFLEDASAPVDLILCDIVMPDGGAPRLREELAASRPELLSRLVFITGGTTCAASAAFAREHADLVHEKPLGLAQVEALVDRAERAHAKPS